MSGFEETLRAHVVVRLGCKGDVGLKDRPGVVEIAELESLVLVCQENVPKDNRKYKFSRQI